MHHSVPKRTISSVSQATGRKQKSLWFSLRVETLPVLDHKIDAPGGPRGFAAQGWDGKSTQSAVQILVEKAKRKKKKEKEGKKVPVLRPHSEQELCLH